SQEQREYRSKVVEIMPSDERSRIMLANLAQTWRATGQFQMLMNTVLFVALTIMLSVGRLTVMHAKDVSDLALLFYDLTPSVFAVIAWLFFSAFEKLRSADRLSSLLQSASARYHKEH